ncbi:hypothetical protein BN1708_003423, partial [Verticillium longisporum]
MFTISVNPLIEWASNIPEDSPWNLAVIMPLILLGLYYLFGSIHAIMLSSDWFGNRFTSVTGAATDSLWTRAMYLGLWLDGSILLIAAVLVSPPWPRPRLSRWRWRERDLSGVGSRRGGGIARGSSR